MKPIHATRDEAPQAMSKRIYAADDEPNIRHLVQSFLEREGYDVRTFETADRLLDAFRESPCDLVILDVRMPGTDGFSACIALRRVSTVPIIMLTARDSDADYITGLTIGSDDYFTKPFSPMALVMRVKAIFRRIEMDKAEETASDDLVMGDVRVVPRAHTVYLGDTPLSLSPNEYRLLSYLMQRPDRAVSRDELLEAIWQMSPDLETRVVDDTVKRLRKKLAPGSLQIETVWGYGFRLQVIG